MREQVLVFDFGTTYFKAALVDSAGAISAICRQPTPTRVEGVRREIDPSAFRATVRSMAQALRERSVHGLNGVRAISFSTQANTFVLLDGADRPLAPLIVWNDRRASGIDLPWAESDRAMTGIDALSPEFSVAKLRALACTDPELHTRTRRLMYLGDVFTHWLTGEHCTDASIAWLSGMFDVKRSCWSKELTHRFSVEREWLPRIVRSGTIVGPLLRTSAAELGVPADCVLIMGSLDQFAGAVGVGNISPGGLSETTGTVLASMHCTDEFAAPPSGVLIGPASREGLYYRMAVSDVSASLLEPIHQHSGMSFEQLDALATSPSHLRLDPTQPIGTLRARVLQFCEHEPIGAVVRSVYDAVAGALSAQVRRLAGGTSPDCVRSAGGAARSRRWLQIKANALRVPVLAPATDEPTLLGASALARHALGWRDAVGPSDAEARLILPQ